MKSRYLKNNFVKQVVKFAIVGGLNTGIDLLVLNLLIFSTGRGQQGIFFTLYKLVSFLVASLNSYLMNKHWTFTGHVKRNTSREMVEFFIISGIGLFINVTIASIVVHIPAPYEQLKVWWPSVAALAGTAVGLIWNFFGYKFIVFKKHHPDLLPPA